MIENGNEKEKKMNQYLQKLNPIIKEYFSILSTEFPEFLLDYINTPEMQRIGKIGCAWGTDYTNVFHHKFFYSNLEHSVGCALIVWNFTRDKKQTLAALFHDIAVPVFKHCIDFMNGDHEKQESTEELTTQIIENSDSIMQLLKKEGIKVQEVDDYHKYPIADNDTPKLSSDRLEYTFMNGIYFKEVWDLEKIRKIYENIIVLEGEEKKKELGFKDLAVAEEFLEGASQLWPLWISNKDKLTMQFLADCMKKMFENQFITKKHLYTLSEAEVIEKIKKCPQTNIAKAFQKFEQATKIGESENFVENCYCVSIKTKRRYIIPLVKTKIGNKRIDQISEFAKRKIEDYFNYKTPKYAYFDFNL